MKNIISFRNTSAGGVERFENSAGGVERFDSFHGVDKSFKSSAGWVERFDSSYGVYESFKSSAGGFKDSPHEIQIQPSPEEHKKLFSQNLNCYENTKVQLFVLPFIGMLLFIKGNLGFLKHCTSVQIY